MATEEGFLKELDEYNHEFQLLGILLQYPEKIDEVADTL